MIRFDSENANRKENVMVEYDCGEN